MQKAHNRPVRDVWGDFLFWSHRITFRPHRKTTQHYAKVVQRKVGEDMKALQEKLYGQAGKREAKRRKLS